MEPMEPRLPAAGKSNAKNKNGEYLDGNSAASGVARWVPGKGVARKKFSEGAETIGS